MAVVGAALAGGSAIALAAGIPAVAPLVLGLLILVGLAFERWRYKRLETSTPPAGFEPTPERFIDPETRTPVTVYVNRATGERRYVRE